MNGTRETQLPTKPATGDQVCSTVVDDALERQLATAGQVCTTAVDDVLEAQLQADQVS